VRGRRRLIAQIVQPNVVAAMLTSHGLPTEAPLRHPARGRPELAELF